MKFPVFQAHEPQVGPVSRTYEQDGMGQHTAPSLCKQGSRMIGVCVNTPNSAELLGSTQRRYQLFTSGLIDRLLPTGAKPMVPKPKVLGVGFAEITRSKKERCRSVHIVTGEAVDRIARYMHQTNCPALWQA